MSIFNDVPADVAINAYNEEKVVSTVKIVMKTIFFCDRRYLSS